MKESSDAGKVVAITIEYDAEGYSILLQKGEGSMQQKDPAANE